MWIYYQALIPIPTKWRKIAKFDVCCSCYWHFKDVKGLLTWAMAWYFQQCGICDQQSLRPACAYAQSDQSLCLSLEYSMNFKLLTEHHLEFLSLKGVFTGSSESTLVKIPHCWKSHVTAHMQNLLQEVFSKIWPREHDHVCCLAVTASATAS